MNLFQIFMISLITGLSYYSRRAFGDCQLERPIVIGPLVGLILNDFQTGLIIGANLELIFMGAQAIGGSVPSNVAIGSALGTAVAISSGAGLEGAMVVAIPAAVLASTFEMFAKTISAFAVHGADKYAEEDNYKGIELMMHLGNLTHTLAYFIPTFMALWLGADYISNIMNTIPAPIMNGVSAVGSLLPALGFGLLLNNLGRKEIIGYFFVGFGLAAYIPSFGVMGIAFIGIAYVCVWAFEKLSRNEEAKYE